MVSMSQVLLTARNIFIANLAISDLLLCVFTMPLAMMDMVTKFWVLGPDMVTFLLSSSALGDVKVVGIQTGAELYQAQQSLS